jgi:hypothetical protein
MRDRDLHGWIVETTRNRRRLALTLAVAFPLDLVLAVVYPRVAAFGVALIAVVAICGTWVLTSHLSTWRDELARAAMTSENADARLRT